MKISIRARHAQVLVFGMSARMHVCVGIYDLAFGCVYGATHVRCIALLTHTCASSFGSNLIGDEGAQHIAAALAHNSTLQTLK
jgi:hypothetical protein